MDKKTIQTICEIFFSSNFCLKMTDNQYFGQKTHLSRKKSYFWYFSCKNVIFLIILLYFSTLKVQNGIKECSDVKGLFYKVVYYNIGYNFAEDYLAKFATVWQIWAKNGKGANTATSICFFRTVLSRSQIATQN